MGQFSFDIRDSKGLFKKLAREYELFLTDKISSDLAINFAITAYHLQEWLETETNEDEKTILRPKPKELLEYFQILRDITNGSKHRTISRYIPKLKSTKKHGGAFSSAFSRGYDISALLIEMEDGRELYFEDVASRVYGFWDNFFKNRPSDRD